jgi:hypothetical protein
MKKISTLFFALLVSVSLFAVKVTLKVDMTGHDVSKGVFVTGEVNAWAFTALTDQGKNIFSVTLDLNTGDKLIYYFIRNNSWDGFKDYRETIPVECANSNLKVPGGWDGDRLVIVPATDVVLNHIFSGCLATAIQKEFVDSGFNMFPNPASEKVTLKLNGKAESMMISISDLAGKQIHSIHTDAPHGQIELNLNGMNKGIYLVRASDGSKKHVQKLIVR